MSQRLWYDENGILHDLNENDREFLSAMMITLTIAIIERISIDKAILH